MLEEEFNARVIEWSERADRGPLDYALSKMSRELRDPVYRRTAYLSYDAYDFLSNQDFAIQWTFFKKEEFGQAELEQLEQGLQEICKGIESFNDDLVAEGLRLLMKEQDQEQARQQAEQEEQERREKWEHDLAKTIRRERSVRAKQAAFAEMNQMQAAVRHHHSHECWGCPETFSSNTQLHNTGRLITLRKPLRSLLPNALHQLQHPCVLRPFHHLAFQPPLPTPKSQRTLLSLPLQYALHHQHSLDPPMSPENPCLFLLRVRDRRNLHVLAQLHLYLLLHRLGTSLHRHWYEIYHNVPLPRLAQPIRNQRHVR